MLLLDMYQKRGERIGVEVICLSDKCQRNEPNDRPTFKELIAMLDQLVCHDFEPKRIDIPNIQQETVVDDLTDSYVDPDSILISPIY